jgi:hypothetical protein
MSVHMCNYLCMYACMYICMYVRMLTRISLSSNAKPVLPQHPNNKALHMAIHYCLFPRKLLPHTPDLITSYVISVLKDEALKKSSKHIPVCTSCFSKLHIPSILTPFSLPHKYLCRQDSGKLRSLIYLKTAFKLPSLRMAE